MKSSRVLINNSLWILGDAICRYNQSARSEAEALKARGASLFFLKGYRDRIGLNSLASLLRKSDQHVILSWLMPRELNAMRFALKDRKNFSVVVDDWWIMPHWFMREAKFILFRKYEGIAVRLGQTRFVNGLQPPLLTNPSPYFGWYMTLGAAARLPFWLASPGINLINYFRRMREDIVPRKYVLFPFPLHAENVPLKKEGLLYDFSNTGSCLALWFMRDPHAPAQYTGANLYHDRQQLMDAIIRFEDRPFRIYDCRREKGDRLRLPYDEYMKKNRQSRFLLSTGGLQDTTVPKFLEYACGGTPMIGRRLSFEYPWLDDCMHYIDYDKLCPRELLPQLQKAMEKYPTFRENCLNWRSRLLKLYNVHTLLEMVQSQINGLPIPPGYLRSDCPAKLTKLT